MLNVKDMGLRISNTNDFTILNMKHGYWHVALDQASSFLATFTTLFPNVQKFEITLWFEIVVESLLKDSIADIQRFTQCDYVIW